MTAKGITRPSREGLGLIQGAGWLFQDLDIFIGRATGWR
jgi:hypothetical protein